MAKKSFDTQKVTDKFFTQITDNTQDTQITDETQNTQSEKKKALRGYRYNLLLDGDLNEYLHYAAWINKKSMTQYLNDLIRSEKEKYLQACEDQNKEPFEGWKD